MPDRQCSESLHSLLTHYLGWVQRSSLTLVPCRDFSHGLIEANCPFYAKNQNPFGLDSGYIH
jgi:hypothetical protein